MAKDSYWFRHDSTAGRDLRLRKIQHIYTHWGKGVYWDVIEVLREQDQYKHPNDESSLQMLADVIGCDPIRFLTWYKDCIRIELFSENSGFFISRELSAGMVKWETSKFNGGKGGRPPVENPPENDVDNPTHNPIVTQGITQPEPNGKPNPNHNNTDSTNTHDEQKRTNTSARISLHEQVFEEFRKCYPGVKRGLSTEFENFKKKHSDWATVLPTLSALLEIQKKIRQTKANNSEFVPEWKNLQTWINQRCWEEEMPVVSAVAGQTSLTHTPDGKRRRRHWDFNNHAEYSEACIEAGKVPEPYEIFKNSKEPLYV